MSTARRRAARGRRAPPRFDRRQIALNVDHDVVARRPESTAPAPRKCGRTRSVIGAGHDRPAAGRVDRLDDARIVRRHTDRPDVRLHRPAPDMDDHRRAVDVGERLSRQPGRVMRAGMRTMGLAIRFDEAKFEAGGLIRVAKASAKRLINSTKRTLRALLQLHSSRRKSLCLMDHVNVNRVSLAALGSVLFVMLLVAFSNLVISPRTPARPGLRAAVRRRKPPRPRREAARRKRRCPCCSPRPTLKRASMTPRSARPATISRRAPAPRSARICGASSAVRSLRSPASPIPTR